MQQRFIRNIPSISPEEQLLLRAKRVAIIGCGGLGGYAAELFARLGVGKISLCDGDSFEQSNLNRQCLALPGTLGQNKAEAAARRIGDIDCQIQLCVFPEMFTAENADTILADADIVIDALDNIPSRLLLEQACARQGLILIHGAVSGWTVQVCAALPGSMTLSRLYANSAGVGEKSVLPHVPAICAGLQCSLALKYLLSRKAAPCLFVLDTESMDVLELPLP